MQNLFTNILDFIFPPSEDMLRVRQATAESVLRKQSLHIHHDIVSLARFEDKTIRALIHEAKFHGSSKACTLLGVLLNTYICKTHADIEVCIPIPLSPLRKRERGFNQVEEILFESDIPSHTIARRVLCRTKHTAPQTTLSKEERLQNMKGVFHVKKPSEVTGKNILLIDDVFTTGATLREAKKEISKHNPNSIILLALAH